MFDNLRFEWEDDVDGVLLSWDAKPDEVERVRKAICNGVFGAFDSHIGDLELYADEACIAGEFDLEGKPHCIYVQTPWDMLNNTPRHRWTFRFGYEPTASETLDGTALYRLNETKEFMTRKPDSIEHMWPSALPIMRALKPYLDAA